MSTTNSTPTSTRRVRFAFGDHVLEGDVVDERPLPTFPRPDETLLTVAVDGRDYQVLASDADTV